MADLLFAIFLAAFFVASYLVVHEDRRPVPARVARPRDPGRS